MSERLGYFIFGLFVAAAVVYALERSGIPIVAPHPLNALPIRTGIGPLAVGPLSLRGKPRTAADLGVSPFVLGPTLNPATLRSLGVIRA